MSYQIKVRQLIGIDVKGLKAIVTQPQHRKYYPDGPAVVDLERVEVKHKKDGDWLYVSWDGRGHPQPFACGYSGWHEDHHESEPVVELL